MTLRNGTKGSSPRRGGPDPDLLKIDEVDWTVTVRKALTKKRPASGWPIWPARRHRRRGLGIMPENSSAAVSRSAAVEPRGCASRARRPASHSATRRVAGPCRPVS